MIKSYKCRNDLPGQNCLDDNSINDFINNVLIEMRVIHETMDYTKYNKKPT